MLKNNKKSKRDDRRIKVKEISNKLKTAGYTIKRLKDNGFVVLKMFNAYSESDPRRWSVLIDPGRASVYLTCYHNKENINEIMFELDDGGVKFNRGFFIKTESAEVIINSLIEAGISNDPKGNPFSIKPQ